MADYGAQGGYGGDQGGYGGGQGGYGGDQGGYGGGQGGFGGGQGGYGGDQGGYQQQDPNLVGGGQGGYDQQQAGGYDQDAIKQQKFQEVEQDPNLTEEEKKHRRHKIEEELAAGLGVAAVGYEGYKHHEKKKGEEASGEKKHSFF